MPHEYVPRMINLEQSDYQVVRRVADQRGLGEKGFSAIPSYYHDRDIVIKLVTLHLAIFGGL